jgi:hypothetical protein
MSGSAVDGDRQAVVRPRSAVVHENRDGRQLAALVVVDPLVELDEDDEEDDEDDEDEDESLPEGAALSPPDFSGDFEAEPPSPDVEPARLSVR